MASSIRVARADRANPSNSRKTEERRPTEYGSALKIDNTLDGYVQLWLRLESTRVNLKALDEAYSIAFPNSTPLNVGKKKREEE